MEKEPKNTPNILLRKVREKHFLTIEKVASAVGVDVRTVSRWEAVHSKPRPDTLEKLCNLFKATPEELGYPRNSESEAAPKDTEATLDEETEYGTIDRSASQTTSDLVSLSSLGQRTEYYNREKANPGQWFRWLAYLALGFLCLGFLAFSLIAALGNGKHPPSSSTTTSPYETMDIFCQSLVAKDFDTAYNQFLQSLQQTVPESEITKNYLACTTSPSKIMETHPKGTLLLTSGNGRKYWRFIALQLDNQHIWKISVFGSSHDG